LPSSGTLDTSVASYLIFNPRAMATARKIARTATNGFADAEERLLEVRLFGSSVTPLDRFGEPPFGDRETGN